jgi:translin
MLDEIIKQASLDLLSREKARDEAYSKARKARTLSKQAILFLHSRETEKAEINLKKSRVLIKAINDFGDEHSEITNYEAVRASKQEYTEASILFSIQMGKDYPLPDALGVAATDYIMGLADVPGELRRQTLDHLKSGNLKSAEKNLETMEEIYRNLTSVEEVSLFLKGLRRKLDIIRNVNERTQAEITVEASRERLRKKLAEIEEKLKQLG